jgi:ATP:cob(I)alamin adenosyltransferase
MSIVTKTGDEGLTSLWSGQRVRKDDPRVEAYGTVDELSSFLGLARQAAKLPETSEAIDLIQRDLVRVAGELASVGKRFGRPMSPADVDALAASIEALEARVPLKGFVVPGRTEASARLDVARAVCRRAERRVLALAPSPAGPVGDADSADSADPSVGGNLRQYLNRLSDYLFMLARAEEAAEGKLSYA